jgi:hypothetical protein
MFATFMAFGSVTTIISFSNFASACGGDPFQGVRSDRLRFMFICCFSLLLISKLSDFFLDRRTPGMTGQEVLCVFHAPKTLGSDGLVHDLEAN